MDPSRQTAQVRLGQVRRHELLGTVAVYRVVDIEGPLVLVEVIQAPGLEAGARFRFTEEAVRRMRLLDPRSAAPRRPRAAESAHQ